MTNAVGAGRGQHELLRLGEKGSGMSQVLRRRGGRLLGGSPEEEAFPEPPRQVCWQTQLITELGVLDLNPGCVMPGELISGSVP